MTQIPVLLPGTMPLVPQPDLPGQTPTPGAAPFLTLLAQLLGTPATPGEPATAAPAPSDAEVAAEPGDGDAPDAAPDAAPAPAPDADADADANTAPHGPRDRRSGWLTIDSKPYANIFVDGRDVGPTPVLRLALTPGPHRVRAVTEDGRQQRFRVTIQPGREASRRRLLW